MWRGLGGSREPLLNISVKTVDPLILKGEEVGGRGTRERRGEGGGLDVREGREEEQAFCVRVWVLSALEGRAPMSSPPPLGRWTSDEQLEGVAVRALKADEELSRLYQVRGE